MGGSCLSITSSPTRPTDQGDTQTPTTSAELAPVELALVGGALRGAPRGDVRNRVRRPGRDRRLQHGGQRADAAGALTCRPPRSLGRRRDAGRVDIVRSVTAADLLPVSGALHVAVVLRA